MMPTSLLVLFQDISIRYIRIELSHVASLLLLKIIEYFVTASVAAHPEKERLISEKTVEERRKRERMVATTPPRVVRN